MKNVQKAKNDLTIPSKTDVSVIYDLLKKQPKDFWENKKIALPPGLRHSRDKKESGLALKLAGRVSRECTEEEFYNLLVKHELPALKLSSQEMDLMKAGGLSILGIIGVVISAVCCPEVGLAEGALAIAGRLGLAAGVADQLGGSEVLTEFSSGAKPSSGQRYPTR